MTIERMPRDPRFKKQKLIITRKRRENFDAEKRVEEAASKPGLRNDLLPPAEYELRKLEDLKPPKRLLRKLTPDHLERLIVSMRRHGFLGAILVRDGHIVDGRGRFDAAKKLGLPAIPCLDVSHLTEDEARTASLAMNRIPELGEWDMDELKIEMTELLELDLDLTCTGFTATDIDIITLDDEPQGDADDETLPEPTGEPVSRLGDFYLLGKNRLGCADALEEASYEKLSQGAVAAATLTDAPFNVRIKNNVSGLGKHKHGEFVMASGEMSPEEFSHFLETFLRRCSRCTMESGVLFAFMDWRSIHTLVAAGEAAGLNLINMAVWDKGAGGMGAFYRSAHELIAVFCKGGSPAINNVQLGKHGRDRSNLWRYPGANKPGTSAALALKDHPSPKNVDLIADAMLDVTRRGDIVLDPFLGSGTTIVAAEQAGRVCYGLELDPKYVDVCIRRWEKLTGEQAVHEESGLTFRALEAERRAAPDA